MKYPYRVYKKQVEAHTFWVAESNALKGCIGQGDTAEEAIAELENNEKSWIKLAQQCDIDVPQTDENTEEIRESKEQKRNKKVSILCYGIAFVIAIVLFWPQIMKCVEEIQDMANVGWLRDRIEQTASEADSLTDRLDGIDGTSAAESAIDDAGDAAGNIADILDDMNGR